MGRWGLLALALCGATPGGAHAQASEVAVLWRELETARQQWRVEQAVLVLDVDRYRAERVRRRFRRPMNSKGQEARP